MFCQTLFVAFSFPRGMALSIVTKNLKLSDKTQIQLCIWVEVFHVETSLENFRTLIPIEPNVFSFFFAKRKVPRQIRAVKSEFRRVRIGKNDRSARFRARARPVFVIVIGDCTPGKREKHSTLMKVSSRGRRSQRRNPARRNNGAFSS